MTQILLHRGVSGSEPVLAVGEPGLRLDTRTIIIGTALGNKPVVMAQSVETVVITRTTTGTPLTLVNSGTDPTFAITDGVNTLLLFNPVGELAIGHGVPTANLHIKTGGALSKVESTSTVGPRQQLIGSKTWSLRSSASADLVGAGLFELFDETDAVSLLRGASTGIQVGIVRPVDANALLEVINTTKLVRFSAEPVTADGQLKDSPKFTLRATYDSDPSPSIASATRDFEVKHHMIIGGVSPTSELQFSLNGAIVATLTDAGFLRLASVNAPSVPLQVDGNGTFENALDSPLTIIVGAGQTLTQVRKITFRDQTVPQWSVTADATNQFTLTDEVNILVPVVARLNSPANSLVVTPTGVGFGQTSPQAAVDVSGASRQTEVVASGISFTPNFGLSNYFKFTLTGGATVNAPTNIPTGGRASVFTIAIKQSGGGGNTVTWDPAYIWQNGTPPVMTPTANAVDVFTFLAESGIVRGVSAQNFAS
jgi:hypothetical protein